jgi:hypothetical protein
MYPFSNKELAGFGGELDSYSILQNKVVDVNINLGKCLKETIQLLILGTVFTVEASNIDDLLRQAQQMKLASDPAWLDLLHYKSHVFGSKHSQVDDDAFFLSSNGKYDANAELNASLAAFFESKEESHAQCLFPARLYWLNSKLDFENNLPQVACPRLDQWVKKLDANRVTLLFPSMYLNNPGSMFGHTFLRLDSRKNTTLLNYTLNYAAEYDPDDNGLVYIYNGLTGGYPGVFSVQPYYETVQEYGDVEHRDIWEYSLNLNQQQVDQLVRHTWEVTGIKFDYYFFRENCSYRLLSLLDVAKPGLNMTLEGHPVYAIPVDTVRTIEKTGLITNTLYRPAKNSRIEKMLSQISPQAQQVVFKFIKDDKENNLADFSSKERAQIYELSHEISQLTEKGSQNFLLARSQIELEMDEKTFEYNGVRPEKSHASAKWFIGYGEKEENVFLDIGIRPAFHDLLDSDRGFVKGASISVLDTRFRWYETQQSLELEELTLFNMTSFSPVRKWAAPLSWKLDFSIKNRQLGTAQDANVFTANGGVGYSTEWGNVIFYLLVDTDIEYSKKLDDNYALSIGGESGALFLFENSRMRINARSFAGLSGHEGDRENYLWLYQFDINKSKALRFSVDVEKSDIFRNRETSINYILYF